MTFAEPNNVTGLYDMFVYSDSVTGGWVSLGILISLYLMVNLYLIFSGEQASASFTVSGWLVAMVGTFMYLAELIGGAYFAMCIISLALPLVWNFYQNS